MKPTAKRPGGWRSIRLSLTTREKPALISLIKELYDAAAVNRDLLRARLLAGANDDELLEKYRRKIVEQFFPTRGLIGKLKLGEARKAIRDYRKATGSRSGTVELLMTYVENGTRFTHEFGGMDDRFYGSMESALKELATLLRDEARDLYPHMRDRLVQVEHMASGIGWGFGDFVADLVYQMEKELGGS